MLIRRCAVLLIAMAVLATAAWHAGRRSAPRPVAVSLPATSAPPPAPPQPPARTCPPGTAQERLQAAAKLAGVPWPLRDVSVRVQKAARRLELRSGATVLKTCPIGLGGAPLGDKTAYGDNRTPEGPLYVCRRNAASAYHRFLGLSYPHQTAADRGLAAGAIDRATHRAITASLRAHRQPPWDTPLGGWVGIHGCGSQGDWTLGCVALDDWDVDELWLVCPLGTPVMIEP